MSLPATGLLSVVSCISTIKILILNSILRRERSNVMATRYNMDWAEFDGGERISLLEEANIYGTITSLGDQPLHFIINQPGLSETQEMIIRFVQSPTRPVDFTKLDQRLGQAVLKVHTEFWRFYFKVS